MSYELKNLLNFNFYCPSAVIRIANNKSVSVFTICLNKFEISIKSFRISAQRSERISELKICKF